ncbi:MAG: LysR family transcriptional regulator [Pseudomonadota bacterium]
MDLDALRIFSRVAELRSFTGAADELALPKGRVSTAVRQLETQLGTRLLHRTTRSVRLTPDGEQFFGRARELLGDADELASLFQQAPESLTGRLRLDMPTGIASQLLIPALPQFLAAHPRLEIELSTTDRRVDLVQEGFDCVLRVGQLQDSSLVSRHLGTLPLVNLASPGYLAAYGTPRTLDDLARHRLVHFSPVLGATPPGWEYFDGERYRFRSMPGAVTVNSADAYQSACLAGLGMIQPPSIGLSPLVRQGLLVEVMPEFTGAPMPVSLLYANRRNMSKRLQALITWLSQLLAPYVVAGPG